jgi:hypothetical protein
LKSEKFLKEGAYDQLASSLEKIADFEDEYTKYYAFNKPRPDDINNYPYTYDFIKSALMPAVHVNDDNPVSEGSFHYFNNS